MRTLAKAVLIASAAAAVATTATPAAAEGPSRAGAEMGERVFAKVQFGPSGTPPVSTIARQPVGAARTTAEAEALARTIGEVARNEGVRRYCGMPVMRADPSLDETMARKIPPEVVERSAKRLASRASVRSRTSR